MATKQERQEKYLFIAFEKVCELGIQGDLEISYIYSEKHERVVKVIRVTLYEGEDGIMAFEREITRGDESYSSWVSKIGDLVADLKKYGRDF